MIDRKVASGGAVAEKLSLGRFWNVFRRYFPYLKPYWRELLLLLVIVPLASSVVVVVTPLCTKLIIDVAFPQKDVVLLVTLAVVGTVAMLLDRAFVFLRAALFGHLRVGVLSQLGPQFYQNMLRLRMSYHQTKPVGEKIFLADTDIFDSSEMIGTTFPFMVQFFYQFVIVLITMCFLDWRPVAIAALIAPPLFFLAQYLFNIYRRIDLNLRLRGQELTAQLERTYSAIPVIYSHGATRFEKVRYFLRMARFSLANMLFFVMKEVTIVFVWPSELPALLASLTIGLCGYWVVTGELTVGEWSALNIYIIQAIVPLGILITYYQTMRLRMVPAERVLAMLDSNEHIQEAAKPIKMEQCRGAIEFRNVSFSYDPEKPVLKNVSFTIEPGSKVAFIGESGSGKSTLLNLILRFYDPQSGQVLVDGIDVRELELRSFRRNTGIVLQEPVLFERSIRDNVLYGSPKASEADLKHAATIARLDEFVHTLPNGYDTILHAEGDLALGQKQQISVARCVVGDPKIFLLDEPTSLLDPPSQRTLTKTIFAAAEGRTMFLITHNLTTLVGMDRIFVMSDGELIESGTHTELVARRGHYYHLWKMQNEEAKGAEGAAS